MATSNKLPTPVVVAICVAGFAVTVFVPIVANRVIFTSSFSLSCMQNGGGAAFCDCAADKTLERAELLELFDGERMKEIARGAVDDCR